MRRLFVYMVLSALPAISCNDIPPETDPMLAPKHSAVPPPPHAADDEDHATTAAADAASEPWIRPGKYMVTPAASGFNEHSYFSPDNTGSWYSRDSESGVLREEIRFNWSFNNGRMKLYNRERHVPRPNEWEPEWTPLPDAHYHVSDITDMSFTMTELTELGTKRMYKYTLIAPPGKKGVRP